MNKHKSEDLFLQLGEPLPLPYKPNVEDISINQSRDILGSELLYKRPIITPDKLKQLEQEVDSEINEPSFIQLQRQRPNPIRREFVQKLRDIELINSIENQLEYIKEMVRTNKLTSNEVAFLQDLRYQIEQTIYTSQNRIDTVPINEFEQVENDSPIMQELERLQTQMKLTEPPRTKPLKTVFIIILCTIIFLFIPYLYNLSRYEYCYYYC